MPKPVITVENLSKAYRIGLKEEVPDTLMSAMTGILRAPLKKFHELRKLDTFRHAGGEEEDLYWALKDVSFEVQEGDVLGVIGRNGAGKSTLLKILSRITEPTRGRAVIRGRISSLLEVGTGFHPDLSGRENVYLNGTILGMTKREIDKKFDEIVDFSGVEKFLDTPIKRYSSGMKVRLAFAVAAHLEPEILIIDEVLAVGDAEFQKKCTGKMQDVARGGRTVLFVSHNMPSVETLCSAGLLLSKGSVVSYGHVETAVQAYYNSIGSQSTQSDCGPIGSRIVRVRLLDDKGSATISVAPRSLLRFQVNVDEPQSVYGAILGIRISAANGTRVCTVSNAFEAVSIGLPQGESTIECRVAELRLIPGLYDVHMQYDDERGQSERIENAMRFEVVERGLGGRRSPDHWDGVVVPKSEWSVV